MAISFFDDKANPPREDDIAAALGRASKLWDGLRSFVAERFDPVSAEWNFAGQAYGWSLRIRHKKRPVVYMIPQSKLFLAAFVLGAGAVKHARESDLPPEVIEMIAFARKYAEGTGFRMPIRTKKDLAAAKKLAEIKMAN